MSKVARIAAKLAKAPLAIVVILGVAGLPDSAAAYSGYADTGHGEAPEIRYFTTYELQHMSDNALVDLQVLRSQHIKVQGEMGLYNTYLLLGAIRLMRGPTHRLIERIERARNDEEKKEIIDGLLGAAKKRHKASEAGLLKERKILMDAGLLDEKSAIHSRPDLRENGRVQAYYDLLRATYAKKFFVDLLESMKYRHSHPFKRLFFR